MEVVLDTHFGLLNLCEKDSLGITIGECLMKTIEGFMA